MAKRRANSASDYDAPRKSRSRAFAMLARVGVVVSRDAADFDLADAILRNANRFTGNEWVELVLQIALPMAELEARVFLVTQFYLLDAVPVCEEAMARLIVEARIGDGESMNEDFETRLRRAIRIVAESHLADPSYCLIPAVDPKRTGAERQRVAHEIAKLANLSDDLVRRVVWRTWVERVDLRTAAASLGLPLERVEQIMIRLGTEAHERAGSGESYRAYLDARPPEGFEQRADDGDVERQEGGT